MRIEISTSRSLGIFLHTLHVFALITLFAFLPLPLAIIGSLGILWSNRVLSREYISLHAPHAVVGINYTASTWKLTTANGSITRAEIQASSFVTPMLTLLEFVTELGARRRVVLLRDNVGANAFRQLRVLLNTALGKK